MSKPTRQDVKDYAPETAAGWSDTAIDAALAAEEAAQASRCRVPAEGQEWPFDLAEALLRRVLHNLTLRGLPLGLSAAINDEGASQLRVGGTDGEVRRLEAPYRRVTFG